MTRTTPPSETSPVPLPLDDGPGPALPQDSFELERLVQLSLDRWDAEGASERSRRALGFGFAGRVRGLMPLAAAAAVVLTLLPLGAWAASALWEAWTAPASPERKIAPSPKPRLPMRPEAPAVEDPLAQPPNSDTQGKSGAAAEPREREPSSQEAKAPSPEAKADAPLSEVGAGGISGRRSSVGARSRRAPISARLGLDEASRLRRAGRWAEAAEIYAGLRRQGGPEGHVAAVAEGQLRLEHLRDPAGAYRAFRAARSLLPGGPLEADASLGEAEALLALGRSSQAQAQLKALVRTHPETSAAQRAHRLLEGLEP